MLRLQGNLVGLRILKKSDAEVFCPLVADRRVARYLSRLPQPYHIEDAQAWVKTTRQQARRRESFSFGIEGQREKAIVGMISLMEIKWEDGVAELGYWVGRPYWRRGYAYEAVHFMLRFAFEELKLYRVFAQVLETNKASSNLLRKAGFVPEGISRKSRFQNGRRLDMVSFGLLRPEFRPSKS